MEPALVGFFSRKISKERRTSAHTHKFQYIHSSFYIGISKEIGSKFSHRRSVIWRSIQKEGVTPVEFLEFLRLNPRVTIPGITCPPEINDKLQRANQKSRRQKDIDQIGFDGIKETIDKFWPFKAPVSRRKASRSWKTRWESYQKSPPAEHMSPSNRKSPGRDNVLWYLGWEFRG